MARRRKLLGNVNLLGLNSFGEQSPGDLKPIWGTMIGGGVAGLTSITLGHVNGGTMAANRELYGLLAGLGSAGVLFSMKSTRHAAWSAALGAVLASGLAYLEKTFLGTAMVTAATATTAAAVAAVAPSVLPAGTQGVRGLGIPRVSALNGLGIPRVHALNGLGMRRQSNGTYLNGLGIPSIANQPQSVGTIPGVAGPAMAGMQFGGRPPVSLLGNPSTRSNQVSLLGGPPIHGLSAAYGATLLGGSR